MADEPSTHEWIQIAGGLCWLLMYRSTESKPYLFTPCSPNSYLVYIVMFSFSRNDLYYSLSWNSFHSQEWPWTYVTPSSTSQGQGLIGFTHPGYILSRNRNQIQGPRHAKHAPRQLGQKLQPILEYLLPLIKLQFNQVLKVKLHCAQNTFEISHMWFIAEYMYLSGHTENMQTNHH